MTKKHLLVKVLSSAVVVVGLAFGISRTLAAQSQDPAPQDARAAAMARLLDSKACQQCDLAGASFVKGTDLKGVDLAGAKLIEASFYRTLLANANFSDADLTKANLSMADLTNVNFGGANLDGAVLTGATGANLSGAKTTETTVCPDGSNGPCR